MKNEINFDLIFHYKEFDEKSKLVQIKKYLPSLQEKISHKISIRPNIVSKPKILISLF